MKINTSLKISMCLFLLVISCKKVKYTEVKINKEKLELLQGALKVVVDNVNEGKGSENKSFIVCRRFDYFSSKRFSPSIEPELNFLDEMESEINELYFKKYNNSLIDFSTSSKSSLVFSFSGFNDDFVIISFRDFGNDVILSEDVCSETINQETAYLVKIKNGDFEIKEKSTVHIN